MKQRKPTKGSADVLPARRPDPATYVYCIARGERPPSLSRAPRGLPGLGATRTLEVRPALWLVVADAPVDAYDEGALERGLQDLEWVGACAAGHERLVEHVSRSTTAVPLKLFTIFASDERAVASARKLAPRIQRTLLRIDGCVEWGVRVHVDERRARAAARDRVRKLPGRSKGTTFLLRKKAEHDGVNDTLRTARRDADRAFADIGESARESVRRPPVTREVAARVLLDAVFLVPSMRARQFQSAVHRAQTSLSKLGCEVTLTGPWPPYHFVDGGRPLRR
jgi:hypothetical protein